MPMTLRFPLWGGVLAALSLGALALAAAGCTGGSSADDGGPPREAYRSEKALRGYQIALRQGELLEQLPCYCGCGQDPVYKNLLDCFLTAPGEFNTHAANCQVCLEEALDADEWRASGLSVADVRERIDARYEGRGTPTETPPVPAGQ